MKGYLSDGVDVLVVRAQQVVHDNASPLVHGNVRRARDFIARAAEGKSKTDRKREKAAGRSAAAAAAGNETTTFTGQTTRFRFVVSAARYS